MTTPSRSGRRARRFARGPSSTRPGCTPMRCRCGWAARSSRSIRCAPRLGCRPAPARPAWVVGSANLPSLHQRAFVLGKPARHRPLHGADSEADRQSRCYLQPRLPRVVRPGGRRDVPARVIVDGQPPGGCRGRRAVVLVPFRAQEADRKQPPGPLGIRSQPTQCAYIGLAKGLRPLGPPHTETAARRRLRPAVDASVAGPRTGGLMSVPVFRQRKRRSLSRSTGAETASATTGPLAARGETPATFERRCIPPAQAGASVTGVSPRAAKAAGPMPACSPVRLPPPEG